MNVKEFTDWNKFTLDQHCEILENEFRFSSSGIAKSVQKLIKFYKDHKLIEGKKQPDTESSLHLADVLATARRHKQQIKMETRTNIKIIETKENACCMCKGNGESCDNGGAWIYCEIRVKHENKFKDECGETEGCNLFERAD